MKNIFYLLLPFLFIVEWGCSSEEGQPDALRPEENSQALKVEVIAPFEKWGITHPTGITKSQQIFAVTNRTAENNISLFEIGRDDRTDCITRSRTNGQAFYTSALNATSQEISTLNFHTGQLFITPANENGMTETYSIQLPSDARHLIAAKNDRYVIATGLYEKGRYLLYSLQDQKAEYFLSYPEHPDFPNLDEYSKSVLYASSVLRIKPDGEAFACSDMRSGILDICRIGENRIERIKLLTFYFPQVHISGSTPKNLKVAYDKSTVHGFLDMAVSNDRIYVLYSGKSKKRDRYNLGHCQTLLTFDWMGNQVDTRSLEIPVSHICYDQEEKTLYGIGYTPEAAIVKFSL